MKQRFVVMVSILAFALSGVSAAAAPVSQNASVITGQEVPLVPLLTALALQAHKRIWVLPNTPNLAQVGSMSAKTPLENLLQIVRFNGLVARTFDGTLVIGTPLEVASVLPPQGPVGSSTTKLERAIVPVVGIDAQTLLTKIQDSLPAGTIALPTSKNGIYVIGSQRAVDLVRANADPLAGKVVPVQVYRPNYITAKDALAQINAHLQPTPPESVVADGASNSISIAGPPAYLQQVLALMQQVDVPVRSVDYDVIIAEADPKQVNVQAGITLGQAQTQFQAVGTTAVGTVAPPLPWIGILGFPLSMGVNLAAQLSLSEAHGHAHVLQRLKCFAVNGQSCVTGYQEAIPYPSSTNPYYGTTSYATEDVGVSITLQPQISNDAVTTAADIKYSTIAGTGAGNIPIIASRPTTTTVNTPIGQSFVLTGLYDDSASYNRTGIPILSSIPLIGALFSTVQKQENQQELVVLLTPHVIAGGAPGINGPQVPDIPPLLNSLPGGAPSPAPNPEPPAPAPTTPPVWGVPTPLATAAPS